MHPIPDVSPLASALASIDQMIARIHEGEQVAAHELEALAACIRSAQRPEQPEPQQIAEQAEAGEQHTEQAMAAGAAS